MANFSNLSVGIFHDGALGAKLGKKGTASDVQFFNRKTGERVITFMQPVGERLAAKAQIMSCIDAAIVSLANMTPDVGETVLMLDALGVDKGIFIVPAGAGSAAGLAKGTSLESYAVMDGNPHKLLEKLEAMHPARDVASPPLVSIDHSFAVKGVGEVALGFVRRGIVRRHDKLVLLPAGKDIVVRSLQVHDKDVDSAEAGSRVGLALKGASADELRRGSVLCNEGTMRTAAKLSLAFEKNAFYREGIEEGMFHASVGMQTVPVKVSDVTGKSLAIEAEKPFVFSAGDVFLLLDLNAKKLRLVGKGSAL